MSDLHWTPRIGDPTFLGWLTVLTYFLAAWLCLKAFMSEKSGPPRPYFDAVKALLHVVRKHWPNVPTQTRQAGLWFLLALFLFFLGLNKQLDFQSLLADIGRVAARNGGWYENRRPLQVSFILLLVAAAGFSSIYLWRTTRDGPPELRLSLLGLVLLLSFVLMRALSFHRMDQLIGTHFLGTGFNATFELSAIAVIALGAYRRIKNRSQKD